MGWSVMELGLTGGGVDWSVMELGLADGRCGLDHRSSCLSPAARQMVDTSNEAVVDGDARNRLSDVG